MPKNKKIAIVKMSAIGDIALTSYLPAIIKDIYGESAQIDWFVDSIFDNLLDGTKNLTNINFINLKSVKTNKIFQLKKECKRIKDEFSSNDYSIIIDLQGLIKSAMIAKSLRGKNSQVVGFSWNSAKEGIASLFYDKKLKIDYEDNIFKRNISLTCFALNVDYKSYFDNLPNQRPYMNFNNSDIKMIDDKLSNLSNKKIVIIVPKTSSLDKDYNEDGYLGIIEKINNEVKNVIFVYSWGSEYQQKSCQSIISRTNSESYIFDKRLSFNQIKYLESRADLVIGGDTGPTHIAWLMNVPSVTIFVSTSKERNTYQTKINKSFKIDSNDLMIDDISKTCIDLIERDI